MIFFPSCFKSALLVDLTDFRVVSFAFSTVLYCCKLSYIDKRAFQFSFLFISDIYNGILRKLLSFERIFFSGNNICVSYFGFLKWNLKHWQCWTVRRRHHLFNYLCFSSGIVLHQTPGEGSRATEGGEKGSYDVTQAIGDQFLQTVPEEIIDWLMVNTDWFLFRTGQYIFTG